MSEDLAQSYRNSRLGHLTVKFDRNLEIFEADFRSGESPAKLRRDGMLIRQQADEAFDLLDANQADRTEWTARNNRVTTLLNALPPSK